MPFARVLGAKKAKQTGSTGSTERRHDGLTLDLECPFAQILRGSLRKSIEMSGSMEDFNSRPQYNAFPQLDCGNLEEADSLTELRKQVTVYRSLTITNRSQDIPPLTTYDPPGGK